MQLPTVETGTDKASETDRGNKIYGNMLRKIKTINNPKRLIIQNNSFIPGCNETLTTVNGTFHSPNYPRNYPDGQYCFWRITLITAQQINLIFSSFSLQIENNTDVLYVYDGDNATGEALEVLYGDHPPPKEGICFSSNRIFVVFKSHKEGSYYGFSASYYGVNYSGRCFWAPTRTST